MRSILLLAAAALTACTSSESESETRLTGRNILDAATLESAQSGQVSFSSHVKPILEAKCAVCHNQSGLPGRMSLASREDAVKTGALGAFIIPGQPDKSRFIDHLSAIHASVKAMPPVGETLTPEEAALLRRWISQGAFWPAGSSGKLVTER
jgi:mono/diheme cytochrome c family protein